MKKSLILILSGLLAAFPLSAQTVKVSGTVSDPAGEMLPGAMVVVLDAAGGMTANGVMADIDGRFTIDCAPTDVLLVSFMGMKDERVSVNNRTSLKVVLQEDVAFTLDEAVAIGYGSVRREDLTGSVSNVKMGDIKDSPVTSVDQALQGRIAGADIMTTSGEPGATTSIRIRGTRSIEASNEPLIVVDGVMDAVSDLNDINPADIEDISVLKDASSTAIYGARGANGVILVTTKASALKSSAKPKITFKAEGGISQLPSNLDLMNATEFYLYRMDYNDWRNQNYSTPWSAKYEDALAKGEGTDWIKEITRIAPYQNYYLSLSGGSAKTNYWASVGYSDNQGTIKKSGERKVSTTFSISHELFKPLKVGYKISYTWRNTDNPLTTIGGTNWWNSALYLSPLIGARDDYNPLYYQGAKINTPVSVIENETDYSRRNFLNQTVWAEASLGKYLKWKLQYNYFLYDLQRYVYYASTLPAKIEGAGGDAKRQSYKERRHTFETSLTYKQDWMKTHYVDAVLGFTGMRQDSENLYLAGSGYLMDEMLWNDMGAVVDKETLSPSSYARTKANLSVIARANYNYKQRYYLTFTGRADGASNFADNHKWGFFPSGAFKWNIHNEPFMKHVKNVDELSIKLSAGMTGNDSIGYFFSHAALTTTNGALLNDSRSVIYRPSRIESPNLTWETTTMYNLAFTGKFFNNRLSITAEGYLSHTDNLLLSVKVPQSTGFNSRYANLGRTSNNGVELSIDSRNIVKKDFTWSTTLTLSHNTQMVEDIGTEDYVSAFNSGGNNPYMMMGYVKGYPLNSLWGFTYAGVWHNQEEIDRNKRTHTYVSQTPSQTLGLPKYVDVNHDGVLNQSDLCYLGNADPWLYGGLQNNFRIGNFKINMYWTWSLGGRIYNYSMLYAAGGTYTNQYRLMNNAWHPTRNPESNIPRAGYYEMAVPSDFMIFDASYLRLQDLSLGYTFNFKQGSVFKDLTLTLSGNNLLLFKYYNGFDPDVSYSGGDSKSTVRRMDVGAYPKARRIIFSIQIRY
ncbi:MAG: TonB-dependent receptor [Bacteroidales bacterium]|nr:TonB-dependent receptor [Bacteroidales bacterium]